MLKIAIPAIENKFSAHFGGAEKFIVFEVDEIKKTIMSSKDEFPPPHEAGTYPEFLKSLNVGYSYSGRNGTKSGFNA